MQAGIGQESDLKHGRDCAVSRGIAGGDLPGVYLGRDAACLVVRSPRDFQGMAQVSKCIFILSQVCGFGETQVSL